MKYNQINTTSQFTQAYVLILNIRTAIERVRQRNAIKNTKHMVAKKTNDMGIAAELKQWPTMCHENL